MLHASLPAGHPWQGMSHLGQDPLVLHPQARNGAAAAPGGQAEPLYHHLPHHHHYTGHHLPLVAAPQHVVGPMMGHNLNMAVAAGHPTGGPPPPPVAAAIGSSSSLQQHVYGSSESVCQQQVQHTYQTFHQTYTIHHQTAVRTVTSRQSLEGGLTGGSSMRHASGGSQSGSSHRGTPPSPQEEAGGGGGRSGGAQYRPHLQQPQQQQQLLLERGAARAASFDHTPPAATTTSMAQHNNNNNSDPNTNSISGGGSSPASGSPHSAGGHHPVPQHLRMPPASPASLNVPQKSPFDLTTMTSSGPLAYKSPTMAVRSESVIAAALRPPSAAATSSSLPSSSAPSPSYQQAATAANKIKQEPGSPANLLHQYGHHLASRAVKLEPGGHPLSYHPNSPHSSSSVVTATPPPPHNAGHSLGVAPGEYSPAQLERVGSSSGGLGSNTASASGASRPGGGYNYPSPRRQQAATPISPAGSDGRAVEGTKFRYHSGQQLLQIQPQQQQLGLHQNPSPTQADENNCNSAMSSREGTPGPTRHHPWTPGLASSGMGGPDDLSGPAPNVDISRVKIKEEVNSNNILSSHSSISNHHHSRMLLGYDALSPSSMNDYSRRPSINLSYPAAVNRNSPSDNNNSNSSNSSSNTLTSYPMSFTPSYHHPSHHPHPGMGQQVSLPARSGGGAAHRGGGGHYSHPGRPPLTLPSNSDGPSHHSNVKIGRRPAHLPKVLKFEDPTLPHGWQRKLKQRKHGKQAGRWDVYIYSPCGVKFASRKKLKNFFEKNNLNYDAEQFDFTPYGKHIDQAVASGGIVSTTTGPPHRHHSSASSDGGAGSIMGGGGSSRHSPGSGVQSPASSYTTSSSNAGGGGLPPGIPPEFLSPAHHHLSHHAHGGHHPPSAHLHHSVAAAAAAAASVYVLPSYEFNPMMESPPNANAREIPQNHILNLSSSSSTSAASSSHLTGGGGGGRSTAVAAASNSFPNDIAELLNDPVAAAAETRRFREYHHTTTNNGNNTMGHSPQHPHFNLNHPLHPHHHHHHHLHHLQPQHQQHQAVEGHEDVHHQHHAAAAAAGLDSEEQGRGGGGDGPSEDENRFMSRTIDILSDGNSDLGVMMDMDYMYSE